MSSTADKEEMRKKITSLVMEGERLVLLDSLTGAVGEEAFEQVILTQHRDAEQQDVRPSGYTRTEDEEVAVTQGRARAGRAGWVERPR